MRLLFKTLTTLLNRKIVTCSACVIVTIFTYMAPYSSLWHIINGNAFHTLFRMTFATAVPNHFSIHQVNQVRLHKNFENNCQKLYLEKYNKKIIRFTSTNVFLIGYILFDIPLCLTLNNVSKIYSSIRYILEDIDEAVTRNTSNE